jgi:hypothetical protein
MWLMTRFGFFSIVMDNQNKIYKVRARAKKDLQNLLDEVPQLKNHEILTYPSADYRYRILIDQAQLNALYAHFASTINYGNFKDAIYDIADQKDKLGHYHRVWEEMYGYQLG